MFITGFVTRIKCAFRDKEMIFWTLLFPVMLATLFYFCFSNLDSADAFSPVKTAVVADQAYRQAAGFQAALEEVSKEEPPGRREAAGGWPGGGISDHRGWGSQADGKGRRA